MVLLDVELVKLLVAAPGGDLGRGRTGRAEVAALEC
jgi:hypothetical protein